MHAIITENTIRISKGEWNEPLESVYQKEYKPSNDFRLVFWRFFISR